MLAELDQTLRAAGIELCFAEMKDPVKDKLKRFGLLERFGPETFYSDRRRGRRRLPGRAFGGLETVKPSARNCLTCEARARNAAASRAPVHPQRPRAVSARAPN